MRNHNFEAPSCDSYTFKCSLSWLWLESVLFKAWVTRMCKGRLYRNKRGYNKRARWGNWSTKFTNNHSGGMTLFSEGQRRRGSPCFLEKKKQLSSLLMYLEIVNRTTLPTPAALPSAPPANGQVTCTRDRVSNYNCKEQWYKILPSYWKSLHIIREVWQLCTHRYAPKAFSNFVLFLLETENY